jgi:amino acid adenylation domain-containing protein
VDRLNLERDTSRNPLFDITMVVQNFRKPGQGEQGNGNNRQLEVLPLADESFPEVDYKTTTTKFDMTFLVHEIGDDITVTVEYYTAVFKEETIRRLETHFKNVIKAVAANPLLKLGDIELITTEEKAEVLYTFNDTARAYPAEKTIHRLFAEQVEKTPDHMALVGVHETQQKHEKENNMSYMSHMSYKELNEKSHRLAHSLQEKGVRPDTIVILMEERGIGMVIGLLGILKAGGAYLPVDPDYPGERKQYMLAESGAGIWVGASAPPATSNGNRHTSLTKKIPAASSSNIAYVLYTSGTTGQPKGVMVEHRNVVRLVKNTDYVEFHSYDRILQTGALDFDASTFEIWGSLLNGLTLCLTPKEEIISARHLKENLCKYDITILWLTSPLFNQMVEEDVEIFSGLRHFLVGGDVLSPQHINRLKRRCPGLKVTNGYGPTENTTFSTSLSIDKEYSEAIPIGKPIANSTVYIVDNSGHIQPKGLAGEIWLGGDGISRGYLNNPELTNEKLLRGVQGGSPSARGAYIELERPHGRRRQKLYKTGDQGRWLPDGTIEFLGRIDTQVKIRGFRIELEEIEHQLCGHKLVKETAVLAKKDNSGAKYLCAYVVPETIDIEALKDYLSLRVPSYMVPGLFVTLDKLPLTPNGKVDRQALSGLGEFRRSDDSTYIAPGTHLEKIIANAWQETLNLEHAGLLDNFFDMGGNSINLLKVHGKLEKALEIEIPIVKLFEYTTIRSLAVFLGQGIGDGQEKPGIVGQLEIEPVPGPGQAAINTEIAVIGMAGVFPGAKDIDEFWENLKNGVESIAFFTDGELEKVGIPPDLLNDPNYVKAKGAIDRPEYFDAAFFDYTPREATIMDPQMRIFHQCTWHALEDGGYNPFAYPGRIGLYAGATSNFYWEALTMFSSMGRYAGGVQGGLLRNRDFMCTRISYKLNLKGPSFSVQTACSTSLVAIHLACQGLLNRECEMALAGGVTIGTLQTMGYYYQEGMIESPDGHCRAFDAGAGGLVGGNGAGAVLLKPLEKATAHGDHIYAVIKGSAANNDGLRKVGYTAPSVEGQVEVIRSAQRMAGIEPGTITYIETHGTGTALGDPVEIEALKKAFNTGKKGFCGIGSVKTNVGHLDAASGVTGFIKAVLALKHKLIPPNLHFITPNPKLGIENSPFYVVSRLTEWQVQAHPRRAGVSSLGIGGTNAHVVLEEWSGAQSAGLDERRGGSPCPPAKSNGGSPCPPENSPCPPEESNGGSPCPPENSPCPPEESNGGSPCPPENSPCPPAKSNGGSPCPPENSLCPPAKSNGGSPCPPEESRTHRLILLSAKTKSALNTVTQNMVAYFKEKPGDNFADAVYTLQVGRRPGEYRKMAVCTGAAEAVRALTSASKNKQERAQSMFCKVNNPPVIFIFSGQGSQYVGMGWKLYQTEPVFREEMDRCFEIARSLGYDLQDILYPGEAAPEPGDREMETVIIQLLVFSFEYALAKLLLKWGIGPFAVIGYSLGEYAAACISGVFSLEGAIKLVAARGELIQTTPPGAMLSVPLREKEIKPLLDNDISLAIVNGPSCVAAGTTTAVDVFEEKMKQKRLLCTRVNISRAVHSKLMEPIREAFKSEVEKVQLNKPKLPFISNVSGHWLTPGEAVDPGYWAEQMCTPVRFSDGIDELIKEEQAVFIEVGPGRVLGNIVRQHPGKKPAQRVVGLIRHQQENAADDYLLHRALGQLWLYGLDINWSGYYAGEKRNRLSLPAYPFEGKRYWIDENIFKGMAEVKGFEKPREWEPGEEVVETPQPPGSQEIIPGEDEEEYEAPRNELEQNIAEIWQEFLGFERIGIYDNFFHLNGDSLTATQLITRIKEIYPVEVTLQDFFTEPTIAHLGQVIKKLLIEKIKNLSPEERKKMTGN